MYYGEMKEKSLREAARYGEKVIACGYCSMQNLLHYQSRVGYTRGVYGWNFDVYEFNSKQIFTTKIHAHIVCFWNYIMNMKKVCST